MSAIKEPSPNFDNWTTDELVKRLEILIAFLTPSDDYIHRVYKNKIVELLEIERELTLREGQ